MNISREDPQKRTLLRKKPIGVGYNRVKNPYIENQKLEKRGNNARFGEPCVEKFVNEMLGRETYTKTFIEIKKVTNLIHYLTIMKKIVAGFLEENLNLNRKKKSQLLKIIVI